MERNLNWLALLIAMILGRFGLRSCSHLARYMHSVAKRPYVMLDTVSEVAHPVGFSPVDYLQKSDVRTRGRGSLPFWTTVRVLASESLAIV